MIKLIDLIKTDDMERTKIKFHKNEVILLNGQGKRKYLICFIIMFVVMIFFKLRF
uniref:hypothetical protein n=1 Tax=Peptoniphilus grossensis TaxID=1465756 RepID=UPI00288BB9D5|nr:hypothetical protein [Peptoniphilus grossensis]